MDSLVAGHAAVTWIYRAGMGVQVVATAQLMCSFGVAPSVLSVVPKGQPVQAGGMMAATIQDFAAERQHHAVRHVHDPVEPAGRGGHLGSARVC